MSRTLHGSALVTGDNLQLVHAIRDWFDMPHERVRLNRWGIEPALFEPDTEIQQKLREMFDLQPGQPIVLSPRGVKPVYQADIFLDAFEMMLREGSLSAKMIALSTGYRSARTSCKGITPARAVCGLEHQTDLIPEWMLQLWLMTDVFVNIPVYDGFSNA